MNETGADGGDPLDDGPAPPRQDEGTTDAFERLFIARLSPRQRARRAAIVAGLPLLALAIILSTFASVRGRVGGLLFPVQPTATFDASPAANRLYLDVDVPWLRITLDGRPVTVPVIVGAHPQPPLRLSNGQHTLAWRGDPFSAMSCTLSVPAAATDTCIPYEEGPLKLVSGQSARLIRLAEDLSTIQPAPRDALMSAIRQTMAATGGSDIVRPGETYYTYENGVVTATTPLTATLNLAPELEPTGGPMDNCLPNVTNSQVSGCPLDTNYCRRICSVTFQYRDAVGARAPAQSWLALITYNPSWSYTSAAGASLGQNEPIEMGGIGVREQLAMLSLTWDTSSWRVTMVYGPNQQDTDILDIQSVGGSPLCLAANDYLNGATDPQILAAYGQTHIVSAPNPAQGCVAVGIVGPTGVAPSPNAPQAIYIDRFGMFLAANSLARENQPASPQADAYEQALALQIAISAENNALPSAAPAVSSPAVRRGRTRVR
jgi:hypothetical protein